jgi:hypothetical protein
MILWEELGQRALAEQNYCLGILYRNHGCLLRATIEKVTYSKLSFLYICKLIRKIFWFEQKQKDIIIINSIEESLLTLRVIC